MFGIGDTELALIVLFGFLLFGPDKLPGMGRTVGRALRQFRTAQEGVNKVVRSEIIDPIQKAADEPASRKAAEDEDADLPEVDAESKPRETFAERRARLAKEKAAAAGGESATPTDDAAASGSEPAKDEPAPEQERPAEPDPTSLEALYGLDDGDLDEGDPAEPSADLDAVAAADADNIAAADDDKEVPPCQ